MCHFSSASLPKSALGAVRHVIWRNAQHATQANEFSSQQPPASAQTRGQVLRRHPNLFGNGLTAAPGEFREPVFGLDVDYPQDRSDWYDPDFFAKQNYIGVGVKTDGAFHPYIAGRVVENLYVAGSEVGGCNSLAEGSGAGVAIMTAFKVADGILGRQEPANA